MRKILPLFYLKNVLISTMSFFVSATKSETENYPFNKKIVIHL